MAGARPGPDPVLIWVRVQCDAMPAGFSVNRERECMQLIIQKLEHKFGKEI